MAELTTNKIRVPLSDVTGNGARTKLVVETLLTMTEALTIEATTSDTEDTYSVDLSWKSYTDWLIRVENSGINLYFRYLRKNADGTYEVYDSASAAGIVYLSNIIVEVTQFGEDLLIAGFQGEGSSLAVFTCLLRVVDQFTAVEKAVASVANTSGSAQYYPIGNFYITEGANTVKCEIEKNANGLTLNGITSAIPAVAYTASADIPLSGFVGDTGLLYLLYQGTAQLPFEARLTNFALDGHGFTSLGQYLCVKTS